jgi:hypothetical protein
LDGIFFTHFYQQDATASTGSLLDSVQSATSLHADAVTNVTLSAVQVSETLDKIALPFHNAERTLGVYEPAVISDVLHHAIDVWSVVKVEEMMLALHQASGMSVAPFTFLPSRIAMVGNNCCLNCLAALHHGAVCHHLLETTG